MQAHYLTLNRNDLEITCIFNDLFYKGRKTTMSFLTIFAFLRFQHGARALIAHYRGQTGGRLGLAVSRIHTLTQITGKWSWMNTLDQNLV